MKGQKTEIGRQTAQTVLLFAAACFLFAFVSIPARAQVTVSSPASGYPITDNLEIRQSHPVTGNRRPHRGVDYGTPLGTTINTPGPVTCHSDPGGWGTYARVQLGCNVELLYAHLSSCSGGATSVVTGNSGGSTGPHLHFELKVAGCTVDPEVAYGQDLCRGAVKDSLYNDAKTKLGEFATCSASGSSDNDNPTPPTYDPTVGEDTVVEVPTGGRDPVTGIINLGPPYVFVRERDGRVRIEPIVIPGPNTFPPMPPTTDNVVDRTGAGGPVTGCATDTWVEMVNKSVLEVRREMLYNQRYIAKADSILAYSCFSEQMSHAGDTLGVLSESQNWVNRQIDVGADAPVTINVELSTTSLDGAINASALNAYENFLNGSFNHTYLGGMEGMSVAAGLDLEESPGSPQAYANCGTMYQVWQMAKCMNMSDQPLFRQFEELITPESDPRIYPETMSCLNTGITQNMINLARGIATQFDPIVTDLEYLSPPPGTCAPAIFTGVSVVHRIGADRISELVNDAQDAVCVSPGCTFINGQCSP